MDTLVITPTLAELDSIVVFPNGVAAPSPDTAVPLDSTIYIICNITGTRKINNSDTAKYNRIGFNFGGIEWELTAQKPGGDIMEPVTLSNKTYIDSYGKLHLGPEIEVDVELTIGARVVSPNPSGNGYTLDASTTSITFGPLGSFGNANASEIAPYITYQQGDSYTPASGVPSLT